MLVLEEKRIVEDGHGGGRWRGHFRTGHDFCLSAVVKVATTLATTKACSSHSLSKTVLFVILLVSSLRRNRRSW